MGKAHPAIPVTIALLASGCVIPIGPQFDDPEDNYPPFVVNSTPGQGDIFTEGGASGREIAVTLSDHNVHDQLHIRWFVNYPGTGPSSKQLRNDILPGGATPERSPVRIRPDCGFSGLERGQHRLVMSVADRPYLDALLGNIVPPEAPFDSVPPDGNRIRVVWILNCP